MIMIPDTDVTDTGDDGYERPVLNIDGFGKGFVAFEINDWLALRNFPFYSAN